MTAAGYLVLVMILAVVFTAVFLDIQLYLNAPGAHQRDEEQWERWRNRVEQEWSKTTWVRPSDFLYIESEHYREYREGTPEFDPDSGRTEPPRHNGSQL